MSGFTPEEKLAQLASFGFFIAGVGIVLGLQYTVGLVHTPHYFLAHFLFGLFFPFAWPGLMGGTRFLFWFGFGLTAVWHLTWELWEAWNGHPTFDQLVAGVVGLICAWAVYRRWTQRRQIIASTAGP